MVGTWVVAGNNEDSPPRSASPADEPVEHVSREGSVLGTVTRAEMRAGRLRHRSVFVAVLDSAGRLLVHRRSESKDIWPGWWDVSVGGVLAPGEEWSEGAERELAEELGLRGMNLTPLGDSLYEDGDVRLVGRTYLAVSDGPFSCPDGEIAETCWVGRSALARMLREERFLPDGLALVLPRLDGFRGVVPWT